MLTSNNKGMNKILSLIIFTILILDMDAQQTVGLLEQTDGSQDGYVLFAPISSNTTYLIDKCGYQVHTWTSTHTPGQSVYLLQDGNLLRPGRVMNNVFNAGGSGGIIEKFDWDSNLLWTYTLSSTTDQQHHDVLQLPNGNVLAIVWELKTVAEATTAGRNPALLGAALWTEKIVELHPTGANTADIVWEWHVWDHLVQDFDVTKDNYGVINEHPELIDLNFVTGSVTQSDWLHCNALAYNEDLDQIILSCHNLSEIWFIDHSTTLAEAASHTGGAHGRGGDLLYRWGNPQVYDRGTAADQKLYGQHNPHWIETGLNNAGDIMVFNNGVGRPEGQYSSVETFTPPLNVNEEYDISATNAYAPFESNWIYTAANPTEMFSNVISGAQRLPNGNTLICEGAKGNFIEIDDLENIVWKYKSPVGQNGPVSQGSNPTMVNVFRCTFVGLDYGGIAGQQLVPGEPIELNPLAYDCSTLDAVAENILNNDLGIIAINPFSDKIQLLSFINTAEAIVELVNARGQIVESFAKVNIVNGGLFTLSIHQELPSGIYLVRIILPNQNITLKLLH